MFVFDMLKASHLKLFSEAVDGCRLLYASKQADVDCGMNRIKCCTVAALLSVNNSYM